MSDSRPSADRQLEEIVAYLDGELSGEECARVERRLASDEDYRQQLQGIERAWTALDELPMATVDDRFSRTTLTMVVEDAARELETRTRAIPIARRRRWLAMTFGAAAAAALGFVVFRMAWPNPNEALLADLPVIDNVDIYSQFQDIDFLRRLHKTLGSGLEELSGDVREVESRLDHLDAIATAKGGKEWLAGMSDEERANLRAKLNRYHDLNAAEQQRIHTLHDAVTAADDSAQLQRTMVAYQQWLSGLPAVRQFELRSIENVDKRVAKVETWATEMRDDVLLTLNDEQLERFFNEIRGPMNDLRDDVLRGERRDDRPGDKARPGELMGQRFQRWRRELLEQFDDRGRPRRFNEAVLHALPAESRDRFSKLEPDAKVEHFLTWMRQHTVCQGEVTREELEQFFAEELDAEMQEQLLSLPPGEMEKRLQQMYRCPNKFMAQGRLVWEPNREHHGDDKNPGERGRRREGDGPLPFGPPGEFGGPPERGFGPPPGPGDRRRPPRAEPGGGREGRRPPPQDEQGGPPPPRD